MADTLPSRLLTLLAAVVLLGFVSTARAQSGPPRSAPVDQAESGSSGTAPFRLKGVTIGASSWVDTLEPVHPDAAHPSDGFRLRRLRVGGAGNLSKRFGWNLSAEVRGRPSLRTAFVLFRVHDQLHIRGGQVTPPSGIERGTSPLSLELIDRSKVTTQLTSALDTSISVFNEEPFHKWLSYAVTVANGAGFNRRDNNRAKDVVGRLELVTPRLPGLAVVASGSRGEQPQGSRTRAGLGAVYDARTFKVAAEGLRQQLGAHAPAKGFYTIGAYRFRPHITRPGFQMAEVAARFMVMDDPVAAAGSATGVVDDEAGDAGDPTLVPLTTRDMQLAANYYVNRNARLQFNVIVPLDHRTGPSATLLTRAQLVF